MLKTNSSPKGLVPVQNEEVDWELRPGGMLVQRREDDDDAAAAASRGPIITIHVSHGSDHHVLSLPAHSTFGIASSPLHFILMNFTVNYSIICVVIELFEGFVGIVRVFFFQRFWLLN